MIDDVSAAKKNDVLWTRNLEIDPGREWLDVSRFSNGSKTKVREKNIYFRPKQSNSGRCKSGRAHPRTGVRGVSQDGEVPIRVRVRHTNEKPNFARKLQVQEGRSVASSANKEARH